MTHRIPNVLSRTLVLAASLALAAASPGFSANATVSVSGDSTPSDCGAAKKADYAIELAGSLSGCWATFISHYNCQEMNGFSLYTEIGREEFEGKLEGEAVTFDTTYTFTGLFPTGSCPAPAAEKEIVGGCIHYLSGTGLTGLMRFYDVMSGDAAPHYFYEGHITRN
ncbi:hypothetical protein [Paragemmobacter straminiformis]|uniref:Uncharacterized protein n=1 Tax=Paragemmobacter straminiformis TaxID=2045119 RepID=A0A842I5J2_9RHOB|nr:hypothetical protein [Gemmobacter straminiformis]MBC2835090.1 hypothetical protein [Gemmobacter straminiformis]